MDKPAKFVGLSDDQQSALQHFEEDKGSIEVGKLADFVVPSPDATAIDPKRSIH